MGVKVRATKTIEYVQVDRPNTLDERGYIATPTECSIHRIEAGAVVDTDTLPDWLVAMAQSDGDLVPANTVRVHVEAEWDRSTEGQVDAEDRLLEMAKKQIRAELERIVCAAAQQAEGTDA